MFRFAAVFLLVRGMIGDFGIAQIMQLKHPYRITQMG